MNRKTDEHSKNQSNYINELFKSNVFMLHPTRGQTMTTRKFFYIMLILIPLLAIYRSCQVTDSQRYQDQGHLLVLPSENKTFASIRFDPAVENHRGGFILDDSSSAIRIRKPNADWMRPKDGLLLTDRSFVDFGGIIYQFRQYPSDMKWTRICNQPIANLGIENRAAPIAITCNPSSRDDRIVLNQKALQKMLIDALKQNNPPATQTILARIPQLFTDYYHPPIPFEQHQDLLVNDLIQHMPQDLQNQWPSASPKERRILLDNERVAVIIHHKQTIAHKLMAELPRSLKSICEQGVLTINMANTFRDWVKRHKGGRIGAVIRSMKIEDTFQIIDILFALADRAEEWVVRDRYQWAVLDYLSPEISTDTRRIRKFYGIKKRLKQLKKGAHANNLDRWIVQIMAQLDTSDYEKWTDQDRQLINDWFIHRALSTGRMAYILPPKEYPVFLSTVDQGWRLQALVPNMIKITRLSEQSELETIVPDLLQPITLHNYDRIHIGKHVFSFALKSVEQTMSRQLDSNDLTRLGLEDPGTRAIIQEDTGLSQLSLILNSLEKIESPGKVIKGFFKTVEKDPDARSTHQWELSKYQNNRLVSPQSLYGVFQPSGDIPDTYTIAQYSDLLNEVQKNGLLQQVNGFLFLPDLKLLKAIRNTSDPSTIQTMFPLTQEYIHHIQSAPSDTYEQYEKIVKEARRTPAVVSAVRSVNQCYRPAGFQFQANMGGQTITSDPSWVWQDKDVWYQASYRQDLCPITQSDIRHTWVWDIHPWYPESKHLVQREFQKTFTAKSHSAWQQPDLSLISCGKVQLFLNHVEIPLITDTGPEKQVRKWRLENTMQLISAIKWDKKNTLRLIVTNTPPKRTQTNHVGIQVILTHANNRQHPVLTSDIHWQASDGYYFEWQTKGSSGWDTVIINAPYLTAPLWPDIPVIWRQESRVWNLYKSRQCNRYFRRTFHWSGGNAFLQVHGNDVLDVYINGQQIAFQDQAVIPSRMLKKGDTNILAICVKNRFYQPLTRSNSPGLYISPRDGTLQMSTYSYRQNNPYLQKAHQTQRGQFFDRNKQSLPKLRLIQGQDQLMQIGHEIPLARSLSPTTYIKDLVFIHQPDKDFHLLDLPGKKKGYIRLQWSSQDHKIRLIDTCGGRMPNNKYFSYYSVFKKHPHNKKPWWVPHNPAEFQDITPLAINITNLKSPFLTYDRSQIPIKITWKDKLNVVEKSLIYTHYHPASLLSTDPDIDQDGINPQFKLGELLLFDHIGQAYHALEIDDYLHLARPKTQDFLFDLPAVRFKHQKDRSIQMLVSGIFTQDYSLTVNSQALEQTIYTLQDGDHIQMGHYLLKYIADEKGLLAGNVMINGKPGRYYPPGLGLSHTVGVYYPNHKNGLERVMDAVLRGKWTSEQQHEAPDIQLTLDDDLCRMVRDEVRRQIKIVDRRYAYHLKSLKQFLAQAQTPVQQEFYTTQIRNIQKSRQRYGMLVILNENSEILAAVSEPSLESSHDIFQQLQKDMRGALINRSLHDARFRPGSSFKLITAMAGFEYGRDEFDDAGKLLYDGWPFEYTRQLKKTRIGKKAVIVDLENHKRHAMKGGTAFSEALKSSYNVWFAYLGLLLNKSTTHGHWFLPGDVYHAFVHSLDRKMDFPLLMQAERIGFNQALALYHLTYNKDALADPELFFNRNPDVSDDPLTLAASHFPVQTLDQRSIARMAIGQHTVTETPVMNAMIALSLSPKWKGQRPTPRLLKAIVSGDGSILASDAGPNVDRICTENAAKAIQKAMQAVVIKGTGGVVFKASPYRNKLYGKTGTSERGKPGLFDNSWWTCFVQGPDGKVYAIAACFPDAGEGAHHAADCVKRVLDKLWRYEGN
jgi:cell division protein FtsI/penicillin-binding protein 2